MYRFERTVAATIDWLDANGLFDETLIFVMSDHADSFEVCGTVDTAVLNVNQTNSGKREYRLYKMCYQIADGILLIILQKRNH